MKTRGGLIPEPTALSATMSHPSCSGTDPGERLSLWTPRGELPVIMPAREPHQQLPRIERALRAGHGVQHDLI